MNPFTTHPSVRIKGTENNYEPVQCINPNCPNRNPHMHCPFCVNTDNFHDPVILKAHYRVKHVDKGIDFAGLKILRCCDHCDIVGTIKGTKEFKGAHWHCYRCRNGFNRRDEAIKHYRTHFRNPQTTFQIQIAQEVNQEHYEADNAASTITHISHDEGTDGIISSSPLSGATFTTVHQTESSQINGKDGEIQVSVAANETVGAEGQTIMIIQADKHLDPSQVQNALNNANFTEVANVEYTDALEAEKTRWEQKLADLRQKYDKAEAEHRDREQKLKSEIVFLKSKITTQATEIIALQKREQELLNQLSVPLDNQINDLMLHLKSQHEELLHHQLAQVRRQYIQQVSEQNISIISTDRASDNSVQSSIVFVQSPGGSNIRLIEEGASGELSDVTANTERIVIMKAEEIETKSESKEEETQSCDVAESGNSDLVISTENSEKDNPIKMNETVVGEGVVHVAGATALEPMENETVVKVTLPSGAAQTTDDKSDEHGSEKPDQREPGSSPRLKRRKKSQLT